MHFLSEALENYISDHTENEPMLLQELTRETHLKIIQPRMITGHFQGRVLSMLSKLVNPKNILEIGTYTGYSAICLAEGLQKKGQLHTIDINEELEDFQRKYFDLSLYGSQIYQHIGDATEIIPNLNIKFDLLSDNVLWSGKVIEDAKEDDLSTQALLTYNKLLAEDKRVDTVLLPIRDGLTISRVK